MHTEPGDLTDDEDSETITPEPEYFKLTSTLKPILKSGDSLPSYMTGPVRRVTISTRETIIGEQTCMEVPKGKQCESTFV